jgi:hypothetical protein
MPQCSTASPRSCSRSSWWRVDHIPGILPRRPWQQHSAGPGSKGPRLYSWAWIALSPEDDADPGRHYLLIRRNDRTGELAYLRCYSPRPVTLYALVGVAGAALAHRRILPGRQGCHRPGSAPGPPLDLLAPMDHPGHARPCLPPSPRDRIPAPDGLIMLTVNEFRRLFDALLLGARRTLARLLHWGPPGDEDTNTEHAKATTADDTRTNDHDLGCSARQPGTPRIRRGSEHWCRRE